MKIKPMACAVLVFRLEERRAAAMALKPLGATPKSFRIILKYLGVTPKYLGIILKSLGMALK